VRFIIVQLATVTVIISRAWSFGAEAETLPALKDGRAPQTFEELWTDFDSRKEPLDVEVLHQWEQDGVVLKVIRYRVGVFKGKQTMMAAVYGYPKDAERIPGLVQIHGGGGSGTEGPVLANAKEGYATISIAWDGRIKAAQYPIDNEAKQLFWDGKKDVGHGKRKGALPLLHQTKWRFNLAASLDVPIRLDGRKRRDANRLGWPRHRHHAPGRLGLGGFETAKSGMDQELGNPTRQRDCY
jgi:hypothetical protein